MSKLEKIWLKRGKLAPMDEVYKVKMKSGSGLVGNLEQNTFRQITIIEKEVWNDLMLKFKSTLPPTIRRANLMVSRISLENSRKKILLIGNCEIEIFGQTKPCELMDKSIDGLQQAMYGNWKGGAFGKALTDGFITQGDFVRWKK